MSKLKSTVNSYATRSSLWSRPNLMKTKLRLLLATKICLIHPALKKLELPNVDHLSALVRTRWTQLKEREAWLQLYQTRSELVVLQSLSTISTSQTTCVTLETSWLAVPRRSHSVWQTLVKSPSTSTSIRNCLVKLELQLNPTRFRKLAKINPCSLQLPSQLVRTLGMAVYATRFLLISKADPPILLTLLPTWRSLSCPWALI